MSYQASEKLQKIQSKYTIDGGVWTDEIAEQELVLHYLTPEDSVLEIGGNIGRVSLIISTIVPGERHIVLESNKKYAITLQKNRDRNQASFKVEASALSSSPLYQHPKGWTTFTDSEYNHESFEKRIPPGTSKSEFVPVSTISLPGLKDKYRISFNTLIIDCEGAFYYILIDYPEILEGVTKVIVENDYPDVSHKRFVETLYLKYGLTLVENHNLPEAYHRFHPNPEIHQSFYQVWIKKDK